VEGDRGDGGNYSATTNPVGTKAASYIRQVFSAVKGDGCHYMCLKTIDACFLFYPLVFYLRRRPHCRQCHCWLWPSKNNIRSYHAAGRWHRPKILGFYRLVRVSKCPRATQIVVVEDDAKTKVGLFHFFSSQLRYTGSVNASGIPILM
jgi:hypothetical protein